MRGWFKKVKGTLFSKGEDMAEEKCKKCKGTGWVEHTDDRAIKAKAVCPDCAGQKVVKK
jgi:DnaJ-class molecular chaperone